MNVAKSIKGSSKKPTLECSILLASNQGDIGSEPWVFGCRHDCVEAEISDTSWCGDEVKAMRRRNNSGQVVPFYDGSTSLTHIYEAQASFTICPLGSISDLSGHYNDLIFIPAWP
ncbi:unnamed protein product [Protopolystoma xenopodis]|uniref:Uncharacterized protein n=1 Tax=Protopolystoma xenopodis TaxID=117903 RepID=A0A448WT22_9PLAT|nr:unnamed protein product [Protopolystoma xenopodis]